MCNLHFHFVSSDSASRFLLRLVVFSFIELMHADCDAGQYCAPSKRKRNGDIHHCFADVS